MFDPLTATIINVYTQTSSKLVYCTKIEFQPLTVSSLPVTNTRALMPFRPGAHWQLNCCGDKKVAVNVCGAPQLNCCLYWQLVFFQYRMDFTETACVCALVLRVRKDRRKKRHYTSYLTCHIIPHIYAPILLILHPFLKTKQAARVSSQPSKCSGGDVGQFTLSESSRYGRVPSRQTFSLGDIDGTELRCDGDVPVSVNIRLITREKILLKGDVPRRNGNVTYSVNQPYFGFPVPVPFRTYLILAFS